jgi:hypothetical protein
MISFLLAGGCIKETYDMDRVSKDGKLEPSVGIPVFTGKATLADMVKSNENFIPGQNEPAKLVYSKDSVIDLQVKDFYELDQMVSFTKEYTLGDVAIDAFSGEMEYSLGDMSNSFPSPLKEEVQGMNNSTGSFPGFPTMTFPNKSLTGFSNFEYAVFSEGTVDYIVKNNLPIRLDNIEIKLNSSDGQVGDAISIPALAPGVS